MNRLKVAVIVMANEPYRYFAEFIVHHRRLADNIYFVDHRSTRNLSALKIDGVTFVDSHQTAQFQSEVTNAVIRDFKIYEEYDWIFVLDIDEFLPFQNKGELVHFLSAYSRDRVVAFNWRNGVGVYPSSSKGKLYPQSLIDIGPLYVSNVNNPNIKVAVNCRRLSFPFFFRTGAHEVVKPMEFLSRFTSSNKYKSIKTAKKRHFIYHIVSFDRSSFYTKIENYVRQMKMRSHVRGQGGWMVEGYLKDFDDRTWLGVIQNFRVTDTDQCISAVDESFFVRVNIFSHLDSNEVLNLRSRVGALNEKQLLLSSIEEDIYLKNKVLDTDLTKNVRHFSVENVAGTHQISIRTE